MIPKRIVCTHVSEHVLEPKLKYCMNLMRELHPQWDFQFFSDGDARDFVKRECSEYLELYDWYPRPVFKADLFRILVVRRLGGFYLDTDFMLHQPLDPLCEENAVFAFEHEFEIKTFQTRHPDWLRTTEERLGVANYAFGSKAEHPFLSAILEEIVFRTRTIEAENTDDLDVLHATGPDAVTSVYYRHREKWNDVLMLDTPINSLGRYGAHHATGTWRETGQVANHPWE